MLVPPNIGCTSQVEGANAQYGGNTPADNSGRLSHVRVQHSGFEILPGNELNGITLAGVGNGTVVENVQVHNSSDDGIEIFGGTVNLRNIVLTGNDDDSLDVDTGWRGAVQNLLIVQRPAGGDRGFEFSSAGNRTAQTPPAGQPTAAFTLNTTPYISNVTIVATCGRRRRDRSEHRQRPAPVQLGCHRSERLPRHRRRRHLHGSADLQRRVHVLPDRLQLGR